MKPVSRAYFDVFAGYCRRPGAELIGEEVAWFEGGDPSILSIVIRDLIDNDYFGVVFARNAAEGYQFEEQTRFHASQQRVEAELAAMIEVLESKQGKNASMDFFTPQVDSDRFHTNFDLLTSAEIFSPARKLIAKLMYWFDNQDGNFVQQFQSTGFNARVWELYVYMMLLESRHRVLQPKPAPDFHAQDLDEDREGVDFYVEATTINPTVIKGVRAPSQKPTTPDGVVEYVQEYLPIRFAGALRGKLQKRYWDRFDVPDSPFVLAIQDFHDDLSMTYSRDSLIRYLYGLEFQEVSTDGEHISSIREVQTHTWDNKTIDSGFFKLPESENISAVIFNSGGTLNKFTRMGIQAGFASPSVTTLHVGLKVAQDGSSEERFSYQLDGEGHETWTAGLEVFHNPDAKHPLNPSALPDARHTFLTDDGLGWIASPGHISESATAYITTH